MSAARRLAVARPGGIAGDARAWRLGSPMASAIRLNLGDAFLVAVVHAQRHLGQVERLCAAMARPTLRPTAHPG